MSRRTPEVPSLADALAKGFADLNPDDENPSSFEEILEIPEVQESVDIEPPSKPQYGRPTQQKGKKVVSLSMPMNQPKLPATMKKSPNNQIHQR